MNNTTDCVTTDCVPTGSEKAAIAFCVILSLVSVTQLVMILVLIARLKGIKVENEIKMYSMAIINWVTQRIRDLREERDNNTSSSGTNQANPHQQNSSPDSSASPEKVLPDFPGVCNLPPSTTDRESDRCGDIITHNQSAAPKPAPYIPPNKPSSIRSDPRKPRSESSVSSKSNQDQLIHSMAKLMKDGLNKEGKEPQRKDEHTNVVTRPPIASKPKNIVFASYDMANETGQILEDQPCEYEEPVPLLAQLPLPTSITNRNDVVLASYEVAGDHNNTIEASYEECNFDGSEPTMMVGEQPPKVNPYNSKKHKYVNVRVRDS